MNSVAKRITQFKDAELLKQHGLYCFFRPIENSVGSSVTINGEPMLMIGSNNYLGLTHDKRVQSSAIAAIEKFGSGCTGSRFLNGNTVLHNELEKRMAHFLGKEEVLLMTTGFLTNYASIGTLVQEGDFIFSDEENHASIIAGCKASGAKIVVFKHNDEEDLKDKLAQVDPRASKLIVADGVFSMTGEVVNLAGLVRAKKQFQNTFLMIDDAHGIGVLGDKGQGTCHALGLSHEVDFITGTFSKSFASLGGFIAGKREVIDYLRHKARGFIFSAALPPASVAAALEVLNLLETDATLLKKLWLNVARAKKIYERIGLSLMPSKTPILSIRIGREDVCLRVIEELRRKGVFATPVVFPAVSFGHALIRTSFMPTHTESDFVKLERVWSAISIKFKLSTLGKADANAETKDYAFDTFREPSNVTV